MNDFEIYEEDGEKILISYNGKENKVVVPEGIIGIENFDDDFVFHSRPEIEEVILPESLEYIGECAFSECENLKSVKLPSNLFEINMEAFAGCENLEKINLPKNLEIIAPNAFKDCKKLKLESVPSYLIEVQINSFENTTEILKKNPVYVELGDFMYNSETKSVLYALDSDSDDEDNDENYLKDTVLPLDAEILAWNSLSFGRFESINLPKTLQYIGRGAFMFCENLKKIIIPANVETIDSGAFINCKNLEEVIFEGEESIEFGSMAFSGCPKLKSITVPKDSLYEDAFDEDVQIIEK